MKTFFYPRLAAGGIRKNSRMYIPYLLTCIGMVMMNYIILYLMTSESIGMLPGSETVKTILGLGSWVIAVFAGIFLFYTNSFLMRRRKKEFGLYNILGMGKRNIGRILFWEVLLTALISLIAGLAAGIAFSKLAELAMVNIMHGEVTYTLSVSPFAVARTAQVFGVIFVLLFLNAVRQVRFSSAIALLRSENAGERPPKGNRLLGLLGVFLLAVAYYLAVTIEDPVAALFTFFAAVLMVIAGTYLVMISGSVLFCRMLQKKKAYYYRPNHFVSVSSMAYRMKRNGAGLASICILATMVLVMIASTACLYFGEESAIRSRYPRDICLQLRVKEPDDLSDGALESMEKGLLQELEARGVSPEHAETYRVAGISGVLRGDTVDFDMEKYSVSGLASSTRVIYFIPLSDYNRIMGTSETLAPDEVMIYPYRSGYESDTIAFAQGERFRVKKRPEAFMDNSDAAMNMMPGIAVVVPDLAEGIRGLDRLTWDNGYRMLQLKWLYYFDTGMEPEEQISLFYDLTETLRDPAVKERIGFDSFSIEGQEYERADFYGLFGVLFYIGILLSIVFVFAAVLIIYYKQISEGYEDQARFEIMQKVGMTKRDIRRSVNSQLLTVFFLPLAFAVLHLSFAFPIIRRMLLVFHISDVKLFAGTTAVSVIVFALLYTIVYRITSNAYYRIVSGYWS